MANFLETLNAVITGLGGLAQITNQQAKERQDRELEGAKLLAQLKDYEFTPATNIQRSPFFDAMGGGQGIAQGQRVVNVAGQPFIVRPRQTLGERMPGLFAPLPQVPKTPATPALDTGAQQPSFNLEQNEPGVGASAGLEAPSPSLPGEGIAGLQQQRDRLAMLQKKNTLGGTQKQNIATRIAQLDEEIAALSGGEPSPVQKPAKKRLDEYAPLILKHAQENNIDPALLFTIAHAEKSGEQAVSPKQAKGLMQIIDETWNAYAKGTPFTDPFNPEHSIGVAARYVKDLVNAYGEDRNKIFAAYNAGETEVNKAGGVPNFPETQKYVKTAQGVYPLYQRMFGAPEVGEQMLAASTSAAPLPAQPGETPPSRQGQVVPGRTPASTLPSGTTLPPLPPTPKPLEEMPGIDRNELQQYVMSDPFIQSLKNDRSQDALTKLQARTVQLATEFRAEKRLEWQQKMELRKEEWANWRAGIQQRTSALSEESQRRIQQQMLQMQENRDKTQDRLLADAARREEKDFYTAQSALVRDIMGIKDPEMRKTLLGQAREVHPGERAKLADVQAQVADLGPTARYDAVGLRHEFERLQRLKERTIGLLRLAPLDDVAKNDREQAILAADDPLKVLAMQRNIPNPVKPGSVNQGVIAALLASEHPEEVRRGQMLSEQWRNIQTGVAEAKQRVAASAKAQLSATQKAVMEDAIQAIEASRDANGRINDSVASKQEALLYQSGMKEPEVKAIMRSAQVTQQREADALSRKTAAAVDLHTQKALTTQEILETARKEQGQQGVDLVNQWFMQVDASRRVDGTPDPNVVTQALAALGAAKMPAPVLTMFAEGVGAKAAVAANRALALLPARVEQAQQLSGIRLDEMDHRFAQSEGFKLQQKLLADAKAQPSSEADRDALTSKILAIDVQQDPTAPAQLLALSTQIQGIIGTQNRMAFASALAGVELKKQRGETLTDRDKQVLLTERVYRDRLDTNLTSTEILARAMDGIMAQRRGDPLTDEQQKAVELYRMYTLELNPTPGRMIAAQVSDDPELAMKAEIMRHVELKQLGENAAEKATQTFLHGPIADGTKEKLIRLAELKRSLTQLSSFPKEQRDAFVGMFDMPLEKAKSAAGQLAETLGFRGEKGKEEASAAFQRFHVALNQVKLLSAFREGGKQLTESEALITFGFVPTGNETPVEFASKLLFNMSGVDYVLKMNVALSTSMRRDLNDYSEFIDKTMQDNADQFGMRRVIPGLPSRRTTPTLPQPSMQQIQPRLPVVPVPRIPPTPAQPQQQVPTPPPQTPQSTPLQRPAVAPQQPVHDPDEDFVLPLPQRR